MAVIQGDDWKRAETPVDPLLTRNQAQVRVDNLRLSGRINRAQWLKITDSISEPMREEYDSLFA